MMASSSFAILHPTILPVAQADQHRRGRARVRALSRLARQALVMSCRRSDLELTAFPKTEQGIPLPVKGIHWSVSHKPEVVGGVAAPFPVGLDLETVRPVMAALLDKVADAAEWRLAGGKALPTFFRVWTAKEAVLKAVGQGIAGLSRCRIEAVLDATRMTLSYDGAFWPVEHFWFGGHVAGLAAQQLDVAWHVDG